MADVRARFCFASVALDSKTIGVKLLTIQLENDETVYQFPESLATKESHATLFDLCIVKNVLKGLKTRGKFRKVWISLTGELKEKYLDEEERPLGSPTCCPTAFVSTSKSAPPQNCLWSQPACPQERTSAAQLAMRAAEKTSRAALRPSFVYPLPSNTRSLPPVAVYINGELLRQEDFSPRAITSDTSWAHEKRRKNSQERYEADWVSGGLNIICGTGAVFPAIFHLLRAPFLRPCGEALVTTWLSLSSGFRQQQQTTPAPTILPATVRSTSPNLRRQQQQQQRASSEKPTSSFSAAEFQRKPHARPLLG
uniref:Uncharacterized protein n=1 Tax=Trichogramma kaykai TaxID=54128 RepID=A0ABD2XSE2_9HYME